jgi:hypothetical protein
MEGRTKEEGDVFLERMFVAYPVEYDDATDSR